MKLLIWGAGAIGGTIGAHLARAGHEITLVDQAADHVEAINRHGLEITGPVDAFRVHAPAFTPSAVTGVWDTAFLCVKAHHTENALADLLPHVSEQGAIVSAQNGLNELVISRLAGPERTIGCFVNFGADYIEPGVIHRGNRAAVVIGELDGQITSRIRTLHGLLQQFDDRAVLTDHIWGYLWGKMAYGAMLYATAVTNDSIADALAAPAYRDIYIDLPAEVLAVAAARGVTPEPFDGFDPRAFVPGSNRAVAAESLDRLVTFNRASAKSHSGIWRDLAVRKRKTEVDAHLVPIVELGREAGIPTPLTAELIDILHEIEDGRTPLQSTNLDRLAARLQ